MWLLVGRGEDGIKSGLSALVAVGGLCSVPAFELEAVCFAAGAFGAEIYERVGAVTEEWYEEWPRCLTGLAGGLVGWDLSVWHWEAQPGYMTMSDVEAYDRCPVCRLDLAGFRGLWSPDVWRMCGGMGSMVRVLVHFGPGMTFVGTALPLAIHGRAQQATGVGRVRRCRGWRWWGWCRSWGGWWRGACRSRCWGW